MGKVYYQLLNNGEIGQITNDIELAKLSGFYNEKNIANEGDIINIDGKYILKTDKKYNDLLLKSLKLKKIKEIKDATGQYILPKYSLHTQTNIDNLALSHIEIDENGNKIKVYYTEDDRNKKNEEIENIRIQGLIFQAEVNAIQTIEDLNNYQYKFDMEVK